MILAIDPGFTKSAFALMEKDYSLKAKGKAANEEVLEVVDKLCRTHVVDVVVIERVACYGMPVGREVFETCEWIGRFTERAAQYEIRAEYIYRREEKLNLCNSPKAGDANIRRALIDRFADHDFRAGRGTKANPDYFYGVAADIWAAIAVGVTYLDGRIEK